MPSPAGSLTMISIGLMIASQNTSEAFSCSCSISLFDLIWVAPVSFRRRWALRRRILSAEVSGYANRKTTKIGAVNHIISYRPHLQPFACTAKPATRGPIAGPQKHAAVHAERYTGNSRREYYTLLALDPKFLGQCLPCRQPTLHRSQGTENQTGQLEI
jgi:hypothetical protein